MATSEIEKLERRYAENPQGLTFAPLAEVHRKNGDIARALELLRAGLELHPNYIPASIVLGRCHWDQGDLPAAESAFAHVLRLDDENVIALKSLADINERLGRPAEAKRWLHRLVSVDRSNEEARQQLDRLDAAKQPDERAVALKQESTAAAEVPPEPAAVESLRKPAEATPLDLTPDLAEPPSGPKPESRPEPSPVLEFLDTSEPAQRSPAAAPLAPGPVSATPAPVPGLISQEFEPPKEATYRLHPELAQFDAPTEPPVFHLETAQEVELRSSGASEFRVPNAAEEFLDLTEGLAEAVRKPPPPPEHPAPPPRPAPERIEPAATARPAPLEAAPVKPAPAPAAPAEPPGIAAMQAPGRSYAAHETKGQSVAAFFRALLAARPPGSSPNPPVEASAPAPIPEPLQSAPERVASSSAPPKADGAVSFDDFFGSSSDNTSSKADVGGNPGKDDLDQFQSWLQNLKR
jgi:tetratricopeptide (TPR) repeat protein